MMPTVTPAARAGPPNPDSTSGLVAAAPSSVRRDNECLVIDGLLLDKSGYWTRAVISPLASFVSAAAPLSAGWRCPRHSATAPRRDRTGRRAPGRAWHGWPPRRDDGPSPRSRHRRRDRATRRRSRDVR